MIILQLELSSQTISSFCAPEGKTTEEVLKQYLENCNSFEIPEKTCRDSCATYRIGEEIG